MNRIKVVMALLAFVLALGMGYTTYAQDDRVFIPLVSNIQQAVQAAVAHVWTMEGGDTASVTCNSDELQAANHDGHRIDLACVTYTPTPIPHIEPFADAPLCAEHDDRAWHGIWDYARGCHYDHAHGTNPHDLDGLFGTQFYTWAGGEVSYPWQTFTGANDNYPAPPGAEFMENVVKHRGYKWLVDGDIPCPTNGSALCIKAYRQQIHALPDKMDAAIRLHSFWQEAQLCWGPGYTTCAIVRHGGWMDFGRLKIDNVHYPLPTDSPTSISPQREHRWNGGLFADSVNRGATWYGAHRLGASSLFIEVTSALEPDANLTEHFFCAAYSPQGGDPFACSEINARQNGSNYKGHRLNYNLSDSFDGVTDGKVTLNTYSDRYGKKVSGCTDTGLDCVPLVIEGIPAGTVQTTGQVISVSEMDGPAIQAGEHWFRYPHDH